MDEHITNQELEERQDNELIALCLGGREAAFDVLYHRYRRQLFSYLHRLLPGRKETIEDLFQQTWVKAARKLENYTDQQRFLAWLCRIAHNLVMDHFRSGEGDEMYEVPETLAAALPSPDQAIISAQLETAMTAAIAKLPPPQQEIIRLRKQGMPFKDIAEAQGISTNTALGRMHYAVINLRKMLADYL